MGTGTGIFKWQMAKGGNVIRPLKELMHLVHLKLTVWFMLVLETVFFLLFKLKVVLLEGSCGLTQDPFN